ncbi:MAG: hypothetical protein COV34_00365 [Candidatus Zambryskibacteria bacterium CG10_big_fil_rev_8_21_14_0_10_42_12]|uniref:L,D-TPase catalytic domain-containing protein n=1 Tax=Candidatus Zambryskibacteria bacterium CG10_big_fil_rev_8_21_14_0_10_42_12 TaxID=1975115 RepID=A0A2H0QWW9_9BACT|nr:MAG: hypothetical protein COV34_00365 [Candidatus Zambryskibacteria bacterium CG10_big_fil_rev_8_21_14_0_10_42_12]
MDTIKKEVGLKIPAWLIAIVGILAAAGLFFVVLSLAALRADEYTLPKGLFAQTEDNFDFGPQPVLSDPNYFKTVRDKMLEEKLSFIEADLSAMKVTLYKNGEKEIEVPIATKGREGSWWETPAGIYKIEYKAENHFSSFGHVYQPYSLAFQGNFFIHGWPYYPDGTDVPRSYSGGCIRLETEDAEKIFALAEKDMPVLVFEDDFKGDEFSYDARIPGVTADSYLAVDLSNNFAFLSEEADKKFSVASITKLMSAVVATEYINIEKEVVAGTDLASTSIPRIKPGEVHTVYSLLYPLLLESSNEAAEVIADSIGESWFVDRMNTKADAIGLTDTHFADASGEKSANVSTAEDLYRLAKYLYHNRKFILSLSVDKLGFNVYGDSSFTGLQNLNDIPGLSGYMIGAKVGQSTSAGQTMLAVMELPLQGEIRPVAIVVLGSEDNKRDVRLIAEYLLSRY